MFKASEYSRLYKFPLGRCAFSLRSVEQRARAVGAIEVAELAARGVAEAERAKDLVLRHKTGHGGRYAPEATELDAVVDRYLGGLDRHLDGQMRMYEGEPRGDAAERMAAALFPEGVAAITHLPYPEEHEEINTLLQRARSPELAEPMRHLPELPELLDRLRDRNQEYGELLRREDELPTREEIRRAHDQAQEHLVETKDLIFGLYALRAPDKTEERDHLLEPIVQQNQALAAIRRRRRVPADVDPETGEELSAADAAAPVASD